MLKAHMVTSREGMPDAISADKYQQGENPDPVFHDRVSKQKEISPSVVHDKEEPDNLQQRQNPSEEVVTQEVSIDLVKSEKLLNNLKPVQSLDDVTDASQSNQDGSSLSMVHETEPVNLNQGHSYNSAMRTSESCQEGSSLSTIPLFELDNLMPSQSLGTVILTSKTTEHGTAPSAMPENVPDTLQQNQDPDTYLAVTQFDQEKPSLSMKQEKVLEKLPLRRNPDIGVQVLHSVQEGSPRSKLPEKPSEDGYNWRKYGQKLVRGNQFVRSYYKCTFLSCPAKKQVERTHEGNITNINCRGNHEHPKPQQSPQTTVPLQAKKPEKSSLTRSGDVHKETSHQIVLIETPEPLRAEASINVTESPDSKSNKAKDRVDQDAEPDSKRRKRDSYTSDDNLSSASKTNGGSRIVIQSTSLVDIVNDGYRWRKYGQKLVKGNANPRSYYRCSNTGCPVKKHVERASHDPKVVITTYEGQHDHTMPSARTVTHNTTGADTNVNPQNGEAGPGTEGKEPPGLEMVVHVSAAE
ncbi:hypothetical protein AgCh_007175 [Apium graveolens]